MSGAEKSLKPGREMPIWRNGMGPFSRISRILGLAILLACPGISDAAKKKAKVVIPIVTPEPKKEAPINVEPAAAEPGKPAATFEELNFNRTLIIEGKVEKPSVQFTLLKEPPPVKEIRFETSFLQNILKLDRENTFKAGETYGRE
jgi:hypothetical protein